MTAANTRTRRRRHEKKYSAGPLPPCSSPWPWWWAWPFTWCAWRTTAAPGPRISPAARPPAPSSTATASRSTLPTARAIPSPRVYLLRLLPLIGDTRGNVATGALRQFRDRLTGYSFVSGASSGKTVQLTVDSALNAAALQRPGGRSGAVMLMDYTTGEILCMVSTPADDPASPSESPAEGTYINKAIGASFVPGSVYKLVTLAAAIDNMPDPLRAQLLVRRQRGSCRASRSTARARTASKISSRPWPTPATAPSARSRWELGYGTLKDYAGRSGLHRGAHARRHGRQAREHRLGAGGHGHRPRLDGHRPAQRPRLPLRNAALCGGHRQRRAASMSPRCWATASSTGPRASSARRRRG